MLEPLDPANCRQSILDARIVVYMIKVNTPFLIKQYVGVVAYCLAFGYFQHLMVIKLIPIAAVFYQGSVVATIQGACVEDNAEEVVELVADLLADHEVLHVKAIYGVVNRSVLLYVCVLTFESFKGNDQNGRQFVYLNFFESLFVQFAMVTIPLVLLR